MAAPHERSDRVLTASAYIAAEYDVVWDHFTRAAAYERWYSAPCLEFGTRRGDPVSFGTRERVVYRGTLTRIEKGTGIAHTFQFVDFGFDEPPTTVEVAIEQSGPTVLVSLRHDCTDAPRTCQLISAVGWLKSISRLKTFLETGEPMPWPE